MAASYLAVAVTVLGRSVRPGRTLVPADLLTIVSPYSGLPGARAGYNPLLSDVPYQFFPWFRFIADALRDGHLVGWNPTILGGVPVNPNSFLSTLYPPTWLAGMLAPFDAYNIFVLLHLAWAALGTYTWSRTLGASRRAAWVAGLLTFAAAFWVHWSLHLVHLVAFVWLPWVLAALHRTIVAPSLARAAVLAGAVGAWSLGGNPQFVYNGALLAGVYGVALLVARRRSAGAPLLRPILAVGLGLTLGGALAAPVILPTLALSRDIVRDEEPAPPRVAVPRNEMIRVLVPDATGSAPDKVLYGSNDELRMDSPFVGVTAVVLAGAAAAGWRRRGRPLLLAGLAAVAVLAYTTGVHTLLFELLPGYDRLRAAPSRWLCVVPVLVLPLAALGLDDLGAGDRWARKAAVAVAGAAILAVGAWLAVYGTRAGAPTRFLAGRAALAVVLVIAGAGAALLLRARPRTALGVLFIVVAVEVAFTTGRWYPSVTERSSYPQVAVARVVQERGGRVIRAGEHTQFPPFAPDLAMAYGAADAQAVTPYFPSDAERYLRLVEDYGVWARDRNTAPPVSDPARLASPLLDALDVRTVVAPPQVSLPGPYSRIHGGDPSVYQRSSTGPAAVVQVARPATQEEAWAHIASPTWDPRRSAAVVGLDRPVAGSGGTVSGGARGFDRERWQVDAPGGGVLRVAGRWDPGWSARIDGRATRVLRADGLFRAVVLPPGRHQIDFAYVNPDERTGLLVAGGALVVLLAVGIRAAVLRARVGRSPVSSRATPDGEGRPTGMSKPTIRRA